MVFPLQNFRLQAASSSVSVSRRSRFSAWKSRQEGRWRCSLSRENRWGAQQWEVVSEKNMRFLAMFGDFWRFLMIFDDFWWFLLNQWAKNQKIATNAQMTSQPLWDLWDMVIMLKSFMSAVIRSWAYHLLRATAGIEVLQAKRGLLAYGLKRYCVETTPRYTHTIHIYIYTLYYTCQPPSAWNYQVEKRLNRIQKSHLIQRISNSSNFARDWEDHLIPSQHRSFGACGCHGLLLGSPCERASFRG